MSRYNPASLAYLGDAVFELLVRSSIISEHNVKSGQLHKRAIKLVNAGAQSKMAEGLSAVLNEEETAVYRRGRNAAVGAVPKNARLSDYCRATGVEAVFGHLYLEGKTDRIKQLFEYCMEIMSADG